MLEIELKAWADLEAARARLEELGKKPRKSSVKEDVYFCEAGKDAPDPLKDRVVRLRIEGGRALVTAKEKTIEKGVETSQEIELEARPADAARALLAYLGYRPFLEKRKESRAYGWREGLTVELNRIAGLGDFVEVEALLPEGASEAAVEGARADLRSVLRALGIGEEKIEPTPYMVLLRGRR